MIHTVTVLTIAGSLLASAPSIEPANEAVAWANEIVRRSELTPPADTFAEITIGQPLPPDKRNSFVCRGSECNGIGQVLGESGRVKVTMCGTAVREVRHERTFVNAAAIDSYGDLEDHMSPAADPIATGDLELQSLFKVFEDQGWLQLSSSEPRTYSLMTGWTTVTMGFVFIATDGRQRNIVAAGSHGPNGVSNYTLNFGTPTTSDCTAGF